MSAFYDLGKTPRNILNQAIVRAIVSENNGLLFDPSDMTTMYQDAAGTTPVTAVEQPVGKILDKSGNGNHATQSVTASRPTLSARYNLLTKTEDFGDAVWLKTAGGTGTAPVVTNNYGVAPDGSITAARLQLALNGGTTTTDRSCLLQQPALISGAAYASTFWVKSNTAQSYVVQQRLGLAAQNITIDQTWRAYTHSQTVASDNTHWLALRGAQGTSDAADILIWHPQLIIGATSGPYQRVNTATDYDTDERYFPKYLRFDGVDDYLTLGDVFDIGINGVSINTSVILFESTKSPIAGKSLAAAAGGRYFLGAEPGSFLLASHDSAPPVNIAYSQSIGESVVLSAKLGPHGNRSLSLYKNANLLSTVNTSLTTASYDTTNPFWIGAYPNSTGTTPAHAYLKGGIYGLIVTKSALTDAQRIACERYTGRKAGVTL